MVTLTEWLDFAERTTRDARILMQRKAYLAISTAATVRVTLGTRASRASTRAGGTRLRRRSLGHDEWSSEALRTGSFANAFLWGGDAATRSFNEEAW